MQLFAKMKVDNSHHKDSKRMSTRLNNDVVKSLS